MQVFKCFFIIVRRNLRMLILYAAMFVAISLIISFSAGTQPTENFQDTRTPVTVIDRDNSSLSAALQEFVYDGQIPVSLPDDKVALQDALYSRKTEFILFIPAGFEASVQAGEVPILKYTSVPGSYAAAYLQQQISGYSNVLRTYLAGGIDFATAQELTLQSVAKEVPVTLQQKTVSSTPFVFYYYQYLCYGLSMVMIFGLSPIMISFGKKEVAARIHASALPLRRQSLEMGLGALVLALASLLVFFLASLVLYQKEALLPGVPLSLLNAACFLFFVTALALLIGQVSTNGGMVSALANVSVLGMCFLGGVYVPYEMLGKGVQTVAKFLPSYWYVTVVDIAANGGQMATAFKAMGIQLLFGVAIFSLSLVISRTKQQTE